MTSSRGRGSSFGPELACLGLLVLYLFTAAPSLGWRDAPEFAVTAQTLGIAHPAGFPTYSLAAKALTFLPLGSLPFRLNLFSAFFAAAAAYVLAGLVRRAAPLAGVQAAESGAAAGAAAGAALTWGLCPTVWTNATGTEVYPLNVFFLGVVLLCALCWSAGGGEAWLFAGGFVYGLAAGNHGSVGLYLPGFLAYFFLHSREETWRRFFILFFFFLLGFSVYLYLPLRSAADPTFDWGNPETWSQFWAHVTDRKDAALHFAAVREGPRFLDYAWVFLSRTTPPLFWFLGLPLVAVGVWRVARTDWPFVAALAYVGLFNVVFFIKWTNPTAFLPASFLAAFFGGLGGAWLLSWAGLFSPSRPRAARTLLAAVLAAVFLGAAWLEYPAQDRSGSFLPLETFRADYEALPPEAISLTAILWFHHRAYQDVFRLREDVTVLGLSDFTQPQAFNPVTAERFPRVAVPPGPYSRETGVAYLKKFVAANLDAGREIYWEPKELNRVFYPNLEPALEILFRFTRRPVKALSRETVQAAFDRLRAKINRELSGEGLWGDPEIDAYYVNLLIQTADYLRLHRRPGDALALLRFVEEFFGPEGKDTILPQDRNVLSNGIGVCLLLLGRIKEAEERFREAAARDRSFYDAWANLGLIYLKTGRPEQAREALERAARLRPDFPEAFFHLGEYYRRRGEAERAREYYRQALACSPGEEMAEKIRRALASLSGPKEGSW